MIFVCDTLDRSFRLAYISSSAAKAVLRHSKLFERCMPKAII
jgi:hypothetical protein